MQDFEKSNRTLIRLNESPSEKEGKLVYGFANEITFKPQ